MSRSWLQTRTGASVPEARSVPSRAAIGASRAKTKSSRPKRVQKGIIPRIWKALESRPVQEVQEIATALVWSTQKLPLTSHRAALAVNGSCEGKGTQSKAFVTEDSAWLRLCRCVDLRSVLELQPAWIDYAVIHVERVSLAPSVGRSQCPGNPGCPKNLYSFGPSFVSQKSPC